MMALCWSIVDATMVQQNDIIYDDDCPTYQRWLDVSSQKSQYIEPILVTDVI